MSATTPETVEEGDETAELTEEELEELELEAEDEELEPVELELRPARLGQGIALGAALVGVALSAPFTVLAIPFGIAGLALAAVSLTYRPSKSWLTTATALMFSGVLISGAFGVLPPEIILLSVGAIIIAWDSGQHAISLGNQIGRHTRTHRNQLVHTAATVLAVAVASGVLYGVFVLAGEGYPAPAVAIIVVGIVIAAWLLRK